MTLGRFHLAPAASLFSKSVWQRLYDEAENAYVKEDFTAAFKNFKYLLEQYSHNFAPDILSYKCGLTAAKKGDYETAEKYMRQSFKINPTSEKLHYMCHS
jgi:outer membrane protein assembly factor BamD (BamD/ComL family)